MRSLVRNQTVFAQVNAIILEGGKNVNYLDGYFCNQTKAKQCRKCSINAIEIIDGFSCDFDKIRYERVIPINLGYFVQILRFLRTQLQRTKGFAANLMTSWS